jgi:hypothetical protein
MFSRNEEKKKIEFISEILTSEGFDVKKDFNIKGKFYPDIVAIKGNKLVLFEVKPTGSMSDQSELMQVSGYMGALKENKEFRNMEISGCIISSGTIPAATSLIQELGIHVIDSDKKEEIKKQIIKCIS